MGAREEAPGSAVGVKNGRASAGRDSRSSANGDRENWRPYV